MSVRSHILAAALPFGLFFGGIYAWQNLLVAKSAEMTQIDIYLPKLKMRMCGVEKLRSMGTEVKVKDDPLGGLLVEFPGEPKQIVQVMSVSANRTRIQGAWRTQDDSPGIRKSYENRSSEVAELLLQCN